MIENRVLTVLEYDKILNICSKFAVLDVSKEAILNLQPCSEIEEVNFLLKKTAEAHKLLYTYGASGIEFFDPITDELRRAEMASTLSMAELLRVARLLRSSRIVYSSITTIIDEEITALRSIAESIYFDKYFIKQILSEYISDVERDMVSKRFIN